LDPRTQEFIEIAKKKFGLNNYFLKRYSFSRTVNIFNQTEYTLSMEWLPNHADQYDGGFNPVGTAAIEMDVQSRRFKSVIFVGGKTSADNGVVFKSSQEIIKWIEEETGMVNESQFSLVRQEEGEMEFRSCFNRIQTSPPGFIEVHYDIEGRLTFFSANGYFPPEVPAKKEKFSMSIAEIEHLAKEHVKLYEIPLYEQERYISIYGLDEVYIANGRLSILSSPDDKPTVEVNKVLEWKAPLRHPFKKKIVHLLEKVTSEQAFSAEPSPDVLPITKDLQGKCISAVVDFLRCQYPEDSGKWVLRTLRRDKGYIHAELGLKQRVCRIPQRKLKVIIDAKSVQTVNDIDSLTLMEAFEHFQAPGKIIITIEEAFEKLVPFMTLKPVYVFDNSNQTYTLCGKLDCEYGVDAATGEVFALENL